MVDGMDVSAAIESFALVPASQKLELRQLRAPLSPLVEAIVRDQGYASLIKREAKMPFEARLVLDGPQLQTSAIRWILHASGKDRALSWSGGAEKTPRITEWAPRDAPSPMNLGSHRSSTLTKQEADQDQAKQDGADGWWDDLQKAQGKLDRDDDELRTANDKPNRGNNVEHKRRMPQLVHIVGFHTEHAAQTFVRYWHRRPMTWKGAEHGKDMEDDDLPPIANVEILW